MNYTTSSKISQITDSTLVVGVDVSKAFHVARAVDFRGQELGCALLFENNRQGFQALLEWIAELQQRHDKDKVILGMEPTGHYGHNLSWLLKETHILPVSVLGLYVKRTKELEDNSPTKNDFKDARTIALLVKDGRFHYMRFFDGDYAELKGAMNIHYALTKDLVAVKNQIHCWIDRYFPEFRTAFKDFEGKTALASLQAFPLPEDVLALAPEALVAAWRAKGVLKGIGIKKAQELQALALASTGIPTARFAAHFEIRCLMEKYSMAQRLLDELWVTISALLDRIPAYKPLAQNLFIGTVTIASFLAEVGDPLLFVHPRQLVRLAGLNLKETSSGARHGQSKITKRGRPKLRATMFMAVLGLVAKKDSPFRALHQYYTTRTRNPLKKMQSITALCAKLLRILWAIVKYNRPFDPAMLFQGAAN
jgi:transposase